MFESVNENSGDRALSKAATIFRVLGTFAILGFVVLLIGLLGGGARNGGVLLVVWYALYAALAFLTAHGIDQQRMWGKWLGHALAALSLTNLPIGTIIGVAIVVYLQRASKAGLFTPAAAPPA